jgi:hypothetical protein
MPTQNENQKTKANTKKKKKTTKKTGGWRDRVGRDEGKRSGGAGWRVLSTHKCVGVTQWHVKEQHGRGEQ